MNLELYGKVLRNASLKKYNTYQIGGSSKYIIFPNSIDNLINLIQKLNKENVKYYLLGNGSNVILPDDDFDGVIIILIELNKINIDNYYVTVETGAMLNYLNSYLLNLGYVNFIDLSMIPGTIGASVKGNAGAYGSNISDTLESITVLINNEIKVLKKSDIEFNYRSSNIDGIILSAMFKLVKGNVALAKKEMQEKALKRISTQPLDYPSCGSVFRNPDNTSAGKLIEEAGFKGKVIGGAKVSEKHANFIINYRDAKSSDIIELINAIKSSVYEKNKISLVLEQKIVKWD
jgi:UDP-N-acetylmuramate dehydrogenase